MKVKHLIEELKKVNPELPVWTEGCDCMGDSFSIDVDGDSVTILRSPPGAYDNSGPPGKEYKGEEKP